MNAEAGGSTVMASPLIDKAAAGQIRLRHWADGDAEDIARLLQDKTLRCCLPGAPSACTAAYAARLITEAANQWRAGRAISLAVCDANHDHLLGEVSLNLVSREIGIWLGAEHWRCGHGQSAVQALLRFAQLGLGVRTAQALIRRDNLPSRGLFEKCGFVFAGLQPGAVDQGSVPSLKYLWRATAGSCHIQTVDAHEVLVHHVHHD